MQMYIDSLCSWLFIVINGYDDGVHDAYSIYYLFFPVPVGENADVHTKKCLWGVQSTQANVTK